MCPTILEHVLATSTPRLPLLSEDAGLDCLEHAHGAIKPEHGASCCLSSGGSGFLDAEELCANHAVLGHCSSVGSAGQADVTVRTELQPSSPSQVTSHGDVPSPHHPTLQFLLLDEDDDGGDGAADSAETKTSVHSVPRTSALHVCVDADDQYCLAVVDDETGLPLRPATPEEAWEVERCFVLHEVDALVPHRSQRANARAGHKGGAGRGGSGSGAAAADRPHAASAGKAEVAANSEPDSEAAAPAPAPRRPEPRRCGPCDNCGATESPQWRQGPPAKPLLCNACGMRFRRTNQLLSPGELAAAAAAAAAGGTVAAPPPPNTSRGRKRAPTQPASPPATPSPSAVSSAGRGARAAGGVGSARSSVDTTAVAAADAKRPRRAAAVVAAATVAAAIDAYA